MSVTLSDHWDILPYDWSKADAIATALECSHLLGHLLASRGVESAEDALLFLQPEFSQLPNPDDLTDMDAALARIAVARERGEHVFVFGDYDVDGVTGASILTLGLRRYGIEHVTPRLPVREAGFGLTSAIADEAAQLGAGLIVTADNGSAAHDAAERARELGIDLIITDHHALSETLPHAVACVNPQRIDGDSPLKKLSGAAVAFCLIWKLTESDEEIDLAALGTIADVMPLTTMNRALVVHGLQRLRDRPRLGLAELAARANVPIERITAEHTAFQLGPRINAAGRMADAAIALDLVLSEQPEHAVDCAKELDALNQQRKELEQAVFADAESELDAMITAELPAIILAREGWHQGVIGIVASRVQSRSQRPAVIIALEEDGTGRGSVRSGPQCDAAMALQACTEFLTQHGGHRAAGGFSIEQSQLGAFTEAFMAEAARQAEAFEGLPRLNVDAQIGLSEIDMPLIDTLDRMRPFGNGNPKPLFCTCGAEVLADSVRLLRGNHLRFSVREGPRIFESIGFGMGHLFDAICAARKVDIAYTPSINEWRGTATIQLELKDVLVQ